MREPIANAILGSIFGGAIGDAFGAVFEGSPTGLVPEIFKASGFLTDDTQLTLATCEAIAEHGVPDPVHIAASFARWFQAKRVTGLGASTLKALSELAAGAHWALAGSRGERAAGNGAAMRIAPLAFCVNPLLDESRRLIRDVCRITHHSDEAYSGALAVVLAIRAGNEEEQSLEWIASQLPDTSVKDRLLVYATLPPEENLVDIAISFGASGYVVESVPLAIFAARQVGRLGFTGMLEQVIAAGGDTDTNASIACQIAGSAVGFNGLPPELMQKVPQLDLVLAIAQAFAERVGRRAEL
jgi:ADP-ribosyl-[dinitrogen reductase] hydrolase